MSSRIPDVAVAVSSVPFACTGESETEHASTQSSARQYALPPSLVTNIVAEPIQFVPLVVNGLIVDATVAGETAALPVEAILANALPADVSIAAFDLSFSSSVNNTRILSPDASVNDVNGAAPFASSRLIAQCLLADGICIDEFFAVPSTVTNMKGASAVSRAPRDCDSFAACNVPMAS